MSCLWLKSLKNNIITCEQTKCELYNKKIRVHIRCKRCFLFWFGLVVRLKLLLRSPVLKAWCSFCCCIFSSTGILFILKDTCIRKKPNFPPESKKGVCLKKNTLLPLLTCEQFPGPFVAFCPAQKARDVKLNEGNISSPIQFAMEAHHVPLCTHPIRSGSGAK